MKFYVHSTRFGYNAANILPAYPNISNYSKEEIVKKADNGKNIQYRLAVCLDTAEDILRFMGEVKNEIIIQDFGTPEIEIYDSYRE